MKATLMLAALVAAALALAPAALADRPDDRGGMLGVGAIETTSPPTRPDDRAGVRGPGAAPVVVTAQSPSGFDWGSAGIGAVGAFGICLLVFAGAQLVVRERGRHAAV